MVLIILQALCLIVVTTLFNLGMKYVTASVSSVIIYLALPISYLLDYMFLGQVIGGIEMTGVCLIVIVNVSLGYLKAQGLVS